MDYKNNILETIGNTPLVKINKLVADIPALVLAKYETFNVILLARPKVKKFSDSAISFPI